MIVVADSETEAAWAAAGATTAPPARGRSDRVRAIPCSIAMDAPAMRRRFASWATTNITTNIAVRRGPSLRPSAPGRRRARFAKRCRASGRCGGGEPRRFAPSRTGPGRSPCWSSPRRPCGRPAARSRSAHRAPARTILRGRAPVATSSSCACSASAGRRTRAPCARPSRRCSRASATNASPAAAPAPRSTERPGVLEPGGSPGELAWPPRRGAPGHGPRDRSGPRLAARFPAPAATRSACSSRARPRSARPHARARPARPAPRPQAAATGTAPACRMPHSSRLARLEHALASAARARPDATLTAPG